MNRSNLNKIHVMVAILTFRRPGSLRECLDSVQACIRPEGVEVEIVVGNNDPDFHFVGEGNVFETIHIGLGRVSPARQHLLEFARAKSADYLIFVDDDEIVSDRWLYEMINAAIKYTGVAVAGPVLPIGVPDRLMPLYTRERRKTGSSIEAVGAGNLLLDIAATRHLDFDTDWILPVGEDTDFTLRLSGAGLQIVWCDEAIAYEPVAASRIRTRWLFRRYFNNGRALAQSPGFPRLRGLDVLVRLLAGGAILLTSPLGILFPTWMRFILDNGVRNMGLLYESMFGVNNRAAGNS